MSDDELKEDYINLQISAILSIVDEMTDEQLNNIAQECIKELYSRERKTEMEYIKRTFNLEEK